MTWTGNGASYQTLHKRLRKLRGTAKICCFGCTGQKSYDWASLTDDLTDIWDFAPMCRSCHRRYDGARQSMMEDTFALCRNGLVKLTPEIVRECRKRYADGEAQRTLAVEFGVAQRTLNEAIHGKNWSWVN